MLLIVIMRSQSEENINKTWDMNIDSHNSPSDVSIGLDHVNYTDRYMKEVSTNVNELSEESENDTECDYKNDEFKFTLSLAPRPRAAV